MAVGRDYCRNRFIRALPPDTGAMLRRELQRVGLRRDEALLTAGETAPYVYFPSDCMLAALYPMADGRITGVRTIGPEGVAGVCSILDEHPRSTQIVVLQPGTAYRLPARRMRHFLRDGALGDFFLRYMRFQFALMSQTIACTRHHRLQQQLCSWLLQARERLDTECINMTHQSIATMLGVRRAGISDAIGKLQAQGLIQTRRGWIEIRDGAGLEALSCDCHRQVSTAVATLISRPCLAT